MPGITVDELRRQALPSGTEVVAGALGLDREATWPVTLRTRPPAFPHLKGGEIALVATEAMRLLDPGMQLTTVLRSLARVSASAVAVLGEIPNDARELADSVGLPLLALPLGAHLPDLEQAVARTIVDRRTEMHQRSQELYRRLTELAIAGQGVEAILATLAQLTRKDVVLENQAFAVRASATPDGGAVPGALLADLREGAERVRSWIDRTTIVASEPPTMRLPLRVDEARVIAPVAVRDEVVGYLSIVGRRGTLGELDELAASRGAAACAIELSRERAVLETEDRLHADLVESLVTGNFTSAEAVSDRARRLGFELSGRFGAIVFALGDVREGDASALRRLRAAVEREAERRKLGAPVGSHGDRAVLLAPRPDANPAAMRALAGALREAAAREIGAPVSAGVGQIHAGVEGIRLAYQEAEGALAVGSRILGAGQVAYFADLGLYRLLLALRSTNELEAFHQEVLGPLLEYDARNDGELVKTLDAYFAALGSPTDAADRLHVHRNTLLYRLKRIREVAGVDLDDAEKRLALHLALRVGEVLQARQGEGLR